MYGWINDCIEKFLLSQFGEELWLQIKRGAGVKQSDGQWDHRTRYADSSTYDIIRAAAVVTGHQECEIYRLYGAFFIGFVAERGYSDLLRTLGGTLRDWLSRVNLLHSHLEFSLPKIVAPEFWCLHDDGGSPDAFILCYRSFRGAFLAPLVVGSVTEVARRFFNSHVSMAPLAAQDVDGATHSSWRVSFEGRVDEAASAPPLNSSPVLSQDALLREQISSLMALCPHHSGSDGPAEGSSSDPLTEDGSSNRAASPVRPGDPVGFSSAQLCRMFPFHVVFNKSFCIIQLGRSVEDFVVGIAVGRQIDEFFEVTTSPRSWSWVDFLSLAEVNQIGIKTLPGRSASESDINLIGDISFSEDGELAFLLCSPQVKSVADMVRCGMHMTHMVGQQSRMEGILQRENLINANLELEKVVETTAQEADVLKKNFVRYVSHEIRTPLATVGLGMSLIRQQVEQLLADHERLGEVMEDMKHCQVSVDTAVSILGDLLSYENLEAGFLKVCKRPVRLLSFVNETATFLRLPAKEKGVTIEVQAVGPEIEQCFISIDPSKMAQVMRHILSKAISCSQRDSCVTVHVFWQKEAPETEEDQPVCTSFNGTRKPLTSQPSSPRANSEPRSRSLTAESVDLQMFASDSDPRVDRLLTPHGHITMDFTVSNLATDEQSMLFDNDPDFNPEVLTPVGGSGLGMWVSHGLARLHGGRISCKLGHYSPASASLCLELPGYRIKAGVNLTPDDIAVIDACGSILGSPTTSDRRGFSSGDSDAILSAIKAPSSTVETMSKDNSSYFNGKHCLIVDDAPMVRKLLNRALSRRGGICTEVQDGGAAVSCARERFGRADEFDVIFMDYVMPVMEGPAATRALRDLGCKTAILGVTGNVLPEDVDCFMANGANSVFEKPVAIDDIEFFLRNAPSIEK